MVGKIHPLSKSKFFYMREKVFLYFKSNILGLWTWVFVEGAKNLTNLG